MSLEPVSSDPIAPLEVAQEVTADGVCVVHLVWEPLGLTPFQNFVAAYRRNPGGIGHRLLVVYNGFAPGAGRGAYQRMLDGIAHDELVLPHPTQDIPAYFAAAAAATETNICFLNSYCVMLDPSWLQKMYACLSQAGVGLVGATGSWASIFSLHQLLYYRPSAYTGLFSPANPPGPIARRCHPLWQGLRVLRHRWQIARHLATLRKQYAPFPAHHLRTNAFMLRRESMLSMRLGDIRTKQDALVFESGRHSLTAQVLATGQNVLVVGRDGIGYEKDRWAESETFWQGEQGNLLVADNQTLNYAHGTPAERRYYSRFAWGTSGQKGDEPTQVNF